MPLRVCVPCERLFLFEEEAGGSVAECPHCAGTISQPAIRSMRDLPLFRLELVQGGNPARHHGDGPQRISA